MDDEAMEENIARTTAAEVEDASESKDEASSSSSAPRERCKYGASCYRRNEDHKKRFSHPDDPDYNVVPVISDVSNTPDNRPECEYGTRCYRQNPQHKRDFKHTVAPVEKKRKKKVKKEVESDGDSNDDYDFDDPFINDGSSDDYEPSCSGSESSSGGDDEEMEDDTNRTLRDGKKFVRR